MIASYLSKIRGFVIRNRVSIQDIALIVAATLIAIYVIYDIDVFVTHNDPLRQYIEFDELPIVGAIISLGMLIFAWRRSREQKR